MKFKKSLPAFLAVLIFLQSSPAAAEEGIIQKVSNWFSNLKSAIFSKFSNEKSTQESLPSSTEQNVVSAPKTDSQEKTTDTNLTSNTTQAANTKIEATVTREAKILDDKSIAEQAEKMIPTASVNSVGIVDGKVARIELLKFPKFSEPKILEASRSDAKKKIELGKIEQTLLTELTATQKRAKYDIAAEQKGLFDLPSNGFKIVTVLADLPNKPLIKVETVHPQMLVLFKGLFAWLMDRDDEALGIVFDLSQSAQTAVVKEKVFGFLGWILANKGANAFATLSFATALEASPNNEESASFDKFLATSVSELATQTPLAKGWIRENTANKFSNSEKSNPEVLGLAKLLLAERAYDKGQFQQARKLAQNVPNKTFYKEHSRYLAAISLIAQSDSKENLTTAGKELTELFRTVDGSEVFDATATTLGRIHFILGNYKAAHKYLTQVSKDTNLYIEATVDNAWALLRSGDTNHAVGNMFTLHTPYFEGAYMPESYFLKSLGYQEICQFGDAVNGVKQYKQRYNDTFKKLQDFNGDKHANHYEDLVLYLTKKEHKLPGVILREMGRHPEFLRRQKAINAIAKDINQLPTLFPNSNAKVIAWTQKSSDTLKADYKSEIQKFVKARALAMEDELKFLTANISLLEYEIFAGAGNNLALQGAQNFAVNDKNAAPKKEFEDGKVYWPYEDEIWEDELNNFRSRIVDACAKSKRNPAAQTTENKEESREES